MQHALDYLSLNDALRYRSVCKTWLNHIDDCLISACHPACFHSMRLTRALLNAYPEKTNEYFLICMLGGYHTYSTFPPRDINDYIQYAIRTNNVSLLRRLIATGYSFDVKTAIDGSENFRTLVSFTRMPNYLYDNTTRNLVSAQRAKIYKPIRVMIYACVAIALVLVIRVMIPLMIVLRSS